MEKTELTKSERYSWIKDIAEAMYTKKVYSYIDFESWMNISKIAVEGWDELGMDVPDIDRRLYSISSDAVNYGNLVGAEVDYDTFGEFSRRYMDAVRKYLELKTEMFPE